MSHRRRTSIFTRTKDGKLTGRMVDYDNPNETPLTKEQRQELLEEAIELLDQACDLLDELDKRHAARQYDDAMKDFQI